MRINYIECYIIDVSRGTKIEERDCCKLLDQKNTLRCKITPSADTDFIIVWRSAAPFGHKRGYGLACTPWLDGIRMPTHVVRPTELAIRTRGEIAGEKSVTQFRPFHFGEPNITDSYEAMLHKDWSRPEPYTIKLVLEWLPNCNSHDQRFAELDELSDNSDYFNVPYFHRTSTNEIPTISAQLGRPVPASSERAQAALMKATPRISSFRIHEAGKYETVSFIFDYKPGTADEPRIKPIQSRAASKIEHRNRKEPQVDHELPIIDLTSDLDSREPSVEREPGPSKVLGKRQRSPEPNDEQSNPGELRQVRAALAIARAKIEELQETLSDREERLIRLGVENAQLREEGLYSSNTIRRLSDSNERFRRFTEKGKGRND